MSRPHPETRQPPPNLAVALAHAAKGRRVFPCCPKTKRPAVPKSAGGNGFKDATTDAEQIKRWWSQYPDSIVGMPTGARSGVFVVDVDVKAGKQGEDTLAQLVEVFGPFPDTIESITATGGRHLFYRHPRDGRLIPNKASKLGQGHETWGSGGYPAVPFERAASGQLITPDVDIRGDGGYVILAGSRMLDGREYTWEGSSDPDEGAELADPPAWLLALVAHDPSAEAPEGLSSSGGNDAELPPIAEGRRNDYLYRLGCSLRAKGLGEAAIVAALLAENTARCQPPLSAEEVTASAKSAASNPPGLSPAYEAKRQSRARQGKGRPSAPPSRPDLRVVGGTEHGARPCIQIENGRLPENTDDAARYLLECDAGIYQHGNRLVRVGRWEGASPGIERPTGSGVLIDISPEWLVDAMTRRIRWEKYDKRSESWVKCDASSKVAKTLLARAGEWPFEHLLGFCDSPTLTPEGRIVDQPGFDRASGLYLSNPPSVPHISPKGAADATQASHRLFSLFDTFPFAQESDRSALLAMVLTALLRRVLPAAPLGCISASTPGTGKSLLADCISVLATGRTAPVAAIGKDSEELEKRIDSLLLKGDALSVFDNVDRAVKSDVLCQVTTQAHKSIRVLAQSRIVEAPTNVTLLMTGNNLTLIGDLNRRAVLCNLDAGCERPELREFERDAIAHVLKHRAEGIYHALMLAKAYHDAGQPRVECSAFGSFEVWDRMIRRPLLWAGWPDPLEPAQHLRENDHEFGGMAELLVAWHAEVHRRSATAAELYELCSARASEGPMYPALYDAAITVMGQAGRWSAKELGYRLRQWSNRIINGYRVVNDGKGKRGVRWRVEEVQG